MFFNNLGVLEDNKIVSRQKDLAVHLLHFMACKKLQPYEHEVIFEKFLCGIPLGHPIRKDIVLSSEHIGACTELLQAVLGHWTSLKTKSVEVLRNEFLTREGRLEIKEERHKLFIERKTFDILLEKLPWNLGIVRLPWKKKLTIVDW